MSKIKRVISFAAQNFARNAWLSIITLSVIVISLVAVNIMVSINYMKNSLLTDIQKRVDITVSLTKAVTADEVNALAADLRKQNNVSDVTVVTPEENLENFKKKFKIIGEKIIPTLDQNPLSYKLHITPVSIDQYQSIIKYIDASPYKDKVESESLTNGYALIKDLVSAYDRMNAVALVIALIFLLLGVIVVFNTIRISIYTQREEVGIMKLVGATNWFIRLPFLLEAIFYSLAATLIAFLIVYPIIQLPFLSSSGYFSGTTIDLVGYYNHNFWLLFVVQFIAIAIINGLSTVVALRKYLRV